MRVLLVTRYFPPATGIATERLLSWAKYLERAGHSVTIFTTEKNGPHDTAFRVVEVPYFDILSKLGLDKKRDTISHTKSWMSRLAKFYRTRLNERMPSRADPWIFSARCRLKEMKRGGEQFDLVISSYGPPASHMIGRFAASLFQAKWIADFRDLWVDNHNYTGLFPFTLLERFLEKKVIREASWITTVSEGLKRQLVKRYPGLAVEVITNGFDPDDFLEPSRKVKNEKFQIVYTGTLYEGKNNLRPLFEALQGSTSIELHFYGTVHEEFFRLIQEYALQDVVFYKGSVSHQKAVQLQQEADALLLIDFISTYDGVLTGKVFEYLYAKPPLLAVGVQEGSELFSLLSRTKAGIVVEDDKTAIQAALLNLQSGNFPPKNREEIQLFSRQAQVQQLLQLFV